MSSKIVRSYEIKEDECEIAYEISPVNILESQAGTVEETFFEEASFDNNKILIEAQSKAAAIIAEAKQTLDEALLKKEDILQTAYSEGSQKGYEESYKKGYAEGFEKAKEDYETEIQEQRENLKVIAGQAKHAFKEALGVLETDIIKLALKIAEKVISRQIEVFPETVITITKDALAKAKDCSSYIVYVATGDYQMVSGAKAELLKNLDAGKLLTILEDKMLQPGNCVIETEKGRIECIIDERLKKIQELIQNGA